MNRFTKSQGRAVVSDTGNILVSAGAGSGKTTVLTARIINKIKNGVNINELLVLTFTNAAAEEMRVRIIEALEKENMQDQEELAMIADITTFDGFLLDIVRKYNYVLGIDKNVNIGDSVQLRMLLCETIQEVLDVAFTTYGSNQKFLNFFDDYMTLEFEPLVENLYRLYEQYAIILDKKRIDDLLTPEFTEELIGKYEQIVQNQVGKIKDKINVYERIIVEEKGIKYREKFIEDMQPLRLVSKYENIMDVLQDFKIPRKTSVKFEGKEKLNEVHDQIKFLLNNLQENLLFLDKEEIRQNEEKQREFSGIILYLLEEIEKKYLEKKKENNIFDFADITNFGLELVDDDMICEEISGKYQEIMIDEYQDTNDFQNRFIEKISRNNRFLVGDVKQSIYGFRNANPQNFNDLQVEYHESGSGEVINLAENFRSREEVLESVNFVFEKIMTKSSSMIDYDEREKLLAANPTFDISGEEQEYFMKFLTYTKDDIIEILGTETIELKLIEPFIIANDILDKVRSGYQVLDNGELRNVTFSDFAILTRNKSRYKVYDDIFRKLKIPLHTQLELFLNEEENHELIVILNILRLICDETDELAYAGIVRSFLYNLDENEIFELLRKNKHQEVKEEIFEKINKLKTYKNYNLNFLYEAILDEFDIVNLAARQNIVQNTYATLLKLEELTTSFSEGGKNLDELINYIEYVIDEDASRVEIVEKSETSNSVELMTIHKSKGLEFPIVYLPDMDKKFKNKTTELIEFNKDIGFVMPEVKDNVRYPTIKDVLSTESKRREELAESIRLLYVAMTRAKEHIIFVGNESKIAKHVSPDIEDSQKFSHLMYVLKKDMEDYFERTVGLENIPKDIVHKKTGSLKHDQKENLPKYSKRQADYEYDSVKAEPELVYVGHASKTQQEIITNSSREQLDLGVKIHNLLELINFTKLEDENYQEEVRRFAGQIGGEEGELLANIVNNLLAYPEFRENVNFWTEYNFIDIIDGEEINGIIDLILEKEEEVLVVDYKLRSVEDDAYSRQLKIYKKYLEGMFAKPVRTYLYSLLNDELVERNV